MPAARVEEVVTRLGRTQSASTRLSRLLGQVCFHHAFRYVGKAATRKCCIQQLCRAIERKLATR
jgi:hypothetical protein